MPDRWLARERTDRQPEAELQARPPQLSEQASRQLAGGAPSARSTTQEIVHRAWLIDRQPHARSPEWRHGPGHVAAQHVEPSGAQAPADAARPAIERPIPRAIAGAARPQGAPRAVKYRSARIDDYGEIEGFIGNGAAGRDNALGYLLKPLGEHRLCSEDDARWRVRSAEQPTPVEASQRTIGVLLSDRQPPAAAW